MMKKYLLFAGLQHSSACNGWDSFRGDFSSKLMAKEYALSDCILNRDYWAHIVDSKTMQIVERVQA